MKRPRKNSESAGDEPGISRAGIREVAAHAGVGIASVSRVLSGQPNVSAEMRDRVLNAAKAVGYAPNLLAQSLRRRATRTVGFVISDISNPLLSSIVGGAEAVLSNAGYSMLLTNSGGQAHIDAARIRLLLQRQVDGLIVLPALEDDAETVAALRRAEVPIVAIDRSFDASLNINAVLSDHHLGIGAATRHLIDLGHRRIALLVGYNVRPARERQKAVADAYAEAGLPPDFIVDVGALSPDRSEQTLARLLELPQPPTAVILGGNQLLEGALKTIRARKLVVGKHLSLVCCDDVPLGRLNQPPIATVGRDTVKLGQEAAALLLERIRHPGPATSTMLETWFEPRGSCGRPILNAAKERPLRG